MEAFRNDIGLVETLVVQQQDALRPAEASAITFSSGMARLLGDATEEAEEVLMAGFKTFDRRAAPLVKEPFVTLQTKGPLSLNRAAYEALGEPVTVELLWDEDERLIGLRPADPSSPRAYPVRGQSGHNYLIAGQAFTKWAGIDTSTARRYGAEMRDGILVIDLKQPGSVATGVRARGGSRDSTEGANLATTSLTHSWHPPGRWV